MKKSLLGLTLVTAFGALALSPNLASACSGEERCDPSVRLFDSKKPIPGNMVRFKVINSDPTLKLRDADGKVVPASVRKLGDDLVFAPDEELPAGLELTLEYKPICPSDQVMAPGSFSFTTSAPAAFSDGVGTLKVMDRGLLIEVEEPAVVLELGYQPPDFGASAHLIQYHASIDGIEVPVRPNGNKLQFDVRTICARPNDTLFTSCNTFTSVPLGDHELKAWSTRVGESGRLAEASITTGATAFECALDDEDDAGVDDGAPKADGVSKAAEAKSDTDDGCSLSPVRDHTRGWLTSLCIALAALALRRTRRGGSRTTTKTGRGR